MRPPLSPLPSPKPLSPCWSFCTQPPPDGLPASCLPLWAILRVKVGVMLQNESLIVSPLPLLPCCPQDQPWGLHPSPDPAPVSATTSFTCPIPLPRQADLSVAHVLPCSSVPSVSSAWSPLPQILRFLLTWSHHFLQEPGSCASPLGSFVLHDCNSASGPHVPLDCESQGVRSLPSSDPGVCGGVESGLDPQ